MNAADSDPKLSLVIESGLRAGIEVRPLIFANETRTAADAAREIGCDVAQIVKSLVFDSAGGPLLFLLSGANRLDLERAAHAASATSLRKADATVVKAATGFSIGATPPFGHATELPVFMDEDLLAYDEVWAAAGRVDSVFPLAPGKLRDATGAAVAALKEV